jgi:hypothetical protein
MIEHGTLSYPFVPHRVTQMTKPQAISLGFAQPLPARGRKRSAAVSSIGFGTVELKSATSQSDIKLGRRQQREKRRECLGP